MDFYQKYLKYKEKYLELKNLIGAGKKPEFDPAGGVLTEKQKNAAAHMQRELDYATDVQGFSYSDEDQNARKIIMRNRLVKKTDDKREDPTANFLNTGFNSNGDYLYTDVPEYPDRYYVINKEEFPEAILDEEFRKENKELARKKGVYRPDRYYIKRPTKIMFGQTRYARQDTSTIKKLEEEETTSERKQKGRHFLVENERERQKKIAAQKTDAENIRKKEEKRQREEERKRTKLGLPPPPPKILGYSDDVKSKALDLKKTLLALAGKAKELNRGNQSRKAFIASDKIGQQVNTGLLNKKFVTKQRANSEIVKLRLKIIEQNQKRKIDKKRQGIMSPAGGFTTIRDDDNEEVEIMNELINDRMQRTGVTREIAEQLETNQISNIYLLAKGADISLEDAAERLEEEEPIAIEPKGLDLPERLETTEEPASLVIPENIINKVMVKTGRTREEVIAILSKLENSKGPDMALAIMFFEKNLNVNILNNVRTYEDKRRIIINAPAYVPAPVLAPVDDGAGLEQRDIEIVMQQTGATRERAIVALRKHNGDLVNAIMDITNNM